MWHTVPSTTRKETLQSLSCPQKHRSSNTGFNKQLLSVLFRHNTTVDMVWTPLPASKTLLKPPFPICSYHFSHTHNVLQTKRTHFRLKIRNSVWLCGTALPTKQSRRPNKAQNSAPRICKMVSLGQSLPPSLREGHKTSKNWFGSSRTVSVQAVCALLSNNNCKTPVYLPYWSSAMCQGLGIRDAGRSGGVKGQGPEGFGAGNVGVQGCRYPGELELGFWRHGNWRVGAGATPGGRSAGEAAPRRTKSRPPAGPECGPAAAMPDSVPRAARTPQGLQGWAGAAAFLTWVGGGDGGGSSGVPSGPWEFPG